MQQSRCFRRIVQQPTDFAGASIVISHRAAVAEAADQVAVVEGSRLVETGPPRVLAASGGAFARLFGAGTGVGA